MDVSPVRSNRLIFSLIILAVGRLNFLFERLEDDDDDFFIESFLYNDIFTVQSLDPESKSEEPNVYISHQEMPSIVSPWHG